MPHSIFPSAGTDQRETWLVPLDTPRCELLRALADLALLLAWRGDSQTAATLLSRGAVVGWSARLESAAGVPEGNLTDGTKC